MPSAGGPTNAGHADPPRVVAPGGSSSVVRLSGDLDIITAEDVKRRLMKLIKDGAPNVVLDLEGVDFVDSSGLGALVALHKLALCSGGRLVVRAAPSRVRRLFSLTRLDEMLIIEA